MTRWNKAGWILGLGIGLSTASHAAANEMFVSPHGTIGGAHAVGGNQGRELGFGVQGSAALEVGLSRVIGLEARVGGIVLAKGEPPEDPNMLDRSTGTAFFAGAGPRFHVLGKTRIDGPWAAGHLGFARTGNLSRVGFDGELGWDFRPGKGRTVAGPYLGYTHVLQPDDSFRPEDARVLSLGLHVAFARPEERTDRDKDSVFDDEDACPDLPGPRSTDRRTNGCPEQKDRDKDGVVDEVDACPDAPGAPSPDASRSGCPTDRDADGIPDAVDACPDVPGAHSTDSRRNGCPKDRDGDGVADTEDACPDLPGIRTSDAATNGCPDRDRDGIPDADDACPDVAGPKTTDPKTSGCPPRDEKVRLEGDRILLDDVVLFAVDSPKVRRRSLGILKKVADFLRKTPDILEVSVEGHADATGTDAHNLTLSRERAESVVRLLQTYDVPGTKVKSASFGRSRLKVQTETAEAANRRVEFYVTRSRVQSATPEGLR